MIPHHCYNRKMQGQTLAETLLDMEVSNRSLLKPLSQDKFAFSFSENSGRSGVCHLNQNETLDKSLELKMVWKSLPSKDEDGRIHEATVGSPDINIVESSNTWGDFEGFNEVKLENLTNCAESLEKLNEKQASTNDVDLHDHQCSTSHRQLFSRTTGHNGKEAFSNVLVKANLGSEFIIKLSFPEVPVPQFSENINRLEQMLDMQIEDSDVPKHAKKQLCTDSGNLWKTLTHSNNPSGIRCPWNESRYQENLLAVLGIDTHQKVIPEGKDVIMKKNNIKEHDDCIADKFNISTSKALIQTKLSVSPDPRQSHLFTYNLFLKKTPSGGNMQYITVPQKKRIFTTQSLKMKMFSSNVC